MNVPRRHHTVSEFYLKGFARHPKKPRLLVIDASTRKHFHANPADLTIERDFNRIDADGVAPGALENAYAEVESEIAPAMERTVTNNGFATDEDRTIIANFVALLLIRNPRMRGEFARFTEDLLKLTMEAVTSTEERWNAYRQQMKDAGYLEGVPDVSYEDYRKFVRKGDYDVRMQRGFFIAEELKLLQKIPQIVAQRNWLVLRAADGSGGYLTCDHPASLMWSDPKMRGGFHGPGLGMPGTQIVFPLSRSLAIVGAFELKSTPDRFTVGAQRVAEINGTTIINAARQVYCTDHETSYVLKHDKKPKRCMALLSDSRFKPDPRPRKPWY